jgi:hypothetical protein
MNALNMSDIYDNLAETYGKSREKANDARQIAIRFIPIFSTLNDVIRIIEV